jgi:histidinol-phosphatase
VTSIPPTDPDLLAAARLFAAEAGALTLEWFRGGDLDLEHKGDGTPVTAADKAAESRLRMRIGEFAPDDAILGEEEGATEGTSGRRWVVDPIDGTKAFTRGVPLYSTLVAVEDEHGRRSASSSCLLWVNKCSLGAVWAASLPTPMASVRRGSARPARWTLRC